MERTRIFIAVILWQAIKNGEFPEWELSLQVFDQKIADSLDFDELDPTKLIPEEIIPLRVVGENDLEPESG